MSPTQEKRISQILNDYNKEIIPLIVMLEISDNEYPVEILNEIRAMMNHLANLTLIPSTSTQQIDEEINKIFSHYKRALFDCYKYLCISELDKYTLFYKQHKYMDMSLIDNGNFLDNLCSLHKDAVEATVYAKKLENNPLIQFDDVFIGYKDAYEKCFALTYHIDNNKQKVEKIKHKHTAAGVLGIAGLVVGIIGIIVGILGIVF